MAERPVTASDWRNVALLIGAAILGFLPGLFMGHIVGHSGALNVNWAQGFAAQLVQGVPLPRWLPEMTGGAGSAVFYFYGPLPFYLAAPFVVATGHAALGVVLAETALLAASGVAAYALLRQFAGPRASLLAALTYLFLPYHFAADIWFRAAFAEQASFVFMPLCLLAILHLGKSPWAVPALAVAFAGQALSHLPTTLLLAPVLVVMAVGTAWQRRSFSVIVGAGVAAVLGTGLAAFYLWPALTLQHMVQPDFWRQVVAADNLLFGPKAMQDLSLFMVPFAISFCLLIGIGSSSLRNGDGAQARLIGLVALVLLALICVPAKPLWLVAGIFARVQFPWRALAIVELLLCILLAVEFEKARGFRLPALAAAMAIGAGIVVAGYTQFLFITGGDQPGVMSTANDRRDMMLKTDASEYLPSCFKWPEAQRKATTHDLAQARADLAVAGVFYYPFLTATRGGVRVELTCDATTGYAVAADGQGGALQFSTIALPEEKMGQWASLASLVVLLGLLARGFATRRMVK